MLNQAINASISGVTDSRIMKVNPLYVYRFVSMFLPFALGNAVFAQSVVQHDYPGLTLTGGVGSNYTIQYVNALANSNDWQTLTNIVLPSSPFLFVDTSAPDVLQRYYRETNTTFAARNYTGLTITGNPGSTNRIQYTEPNGPSTWTTLTTLVVPTSPYLFVDTASPNGARRTYRVQDLARPPGITSPGSALGQSGSPFSYQITVSSDLAITGYGASGLPTGLGVDPGSGLISGTVATPGTNVATVYATNSSGSGSASVTFNFRASLATEMVNVSAGTFNLGSPANEPGRSPDEGPQTQVVLTRGFMIGKYEVSQAEYQAVRGTNPSLSVVDPTRPVEAVSWRDATNFCSLLTGRDRASGRISANSFYRLPTEAEWEYAARAGSSTAYSFGNDPSLLGQYAWFSTNGVGITHPVGQKLPNAWGLFDTAGNTWEYCSDYYGAYPGGAVIDPQGPSTGNSRVLRGGSWNSSQSDCRSAVRLQIMESDRHTDVGFRIVLITNP